MTALRKISIEGFRSIAEITKLDLRPVNVLIGANGSGKSNFLDAFDLLRVTANSPERGREWLPNYVRRVGGAESLLHFGSKHTDQIAFSVQFGPEYSNGLFNYSILLRPDNRDLLTCVVAGHPMPLSDQIEVHAIAEHGTDQNRDQLRKKMLGWRVFHFHDTGPASPLHKTCEVHDNRGLREDGSNLAAALYLLKQRYGQEYNQIKNIVRLAAPFFEDFALEPLELNKETIRLEWSHRRSDAYFNSHSLSDGTLRFIALATLLLQPTSLRPSLILLDEPELGLHPYAITLLASMVKQTSETSQIIMATQSPILLDHFEPEDVLVAERANGATQLSRLNPKDLKAWLKDYSLGELWEKNEFGGRSPSWTETTACRSQALVHGRDAHLP